MNNRFSVKNRLSIQTTVSRSPLSSIAYRLGALVGPTGKRRVGVFPSVRASVIKTRTAQWERIWFSAALVAFLLAAGVAASIYLEQSLSQPPEVVSKAKTPAASGEPQVRKAVLRHYAHPSHTGSHASAFSSPGVEAASAHLR